MVAAWCLLAVPLTPAQQAQTTLSGVVEDAVTHQPIARVLVSSPNGGGGVLTDNSGRFSFDNVSTGNTDVRYRRPGYFDPQTMQPEAFQQVMVQSGASSVTLMLLRGASLNGQLTLPDGESAQGMRVELYAAHVNGGRRYWRVSTTAVAEQDGHFSFNGLAPGSYTVHSEGSTDPVPAGTQPGIRSGYLPAWPPGIGDIASATVYVLRPGDSGEANIAVQRGTYYPVNVPSANEVSVGNCQVTGNGFMNRSLQNDRRAGALTTTLPSGTYMLHCGAGGRGGFRGGGSFIGSDVLHGNDSSGSAELALHVAGGPLQTAPLTLSSTPALSLSIEEAASDEEAATTSAASAGPPRLALLSFLPVDGLGDAQFEPVQYDQDGSPRLSGTPAPGQYWVSATVSGGFLAGLSGGGSDLASTPLTIAPGNALSIAATLGTGGGTVNATLSGDLLTRTCVLQLLPSGSAGTSQTMTLQPGTPIAIFTHVAPGDYLLLATTSKLPVAYREPGVLQAIAGTPVSVVGNDTAEATLSTLATVPPGLTGLP